MPLPGADWVAVPAGCRTRPCASVRGGHPAAAPARSAASSSSPTRAWARRLVTATLSGRVLLVRLAPRAVSPCCRPVVLPVRLPLVEWGRGRAARACGARRPRERGWGGGRDRRGGPGRVELPQPEKPTLGRLGSPARAGRPPPLAPSPGTMPWPRTGFEPPPLRRRVSRPTPALLAGFARGATIACAPLPPRRHARLASPSAAASRRARKRVKRPVAGENTRLRNAVA